MASLQSGQTPMVLPGSKSPAKVQSGFPRNLGDPVVPVEPLLRHGLADLEQSRPVGRSGVHDRRERIGERIDGTAKRRKRSAAG